LKFILYVVETTCRHVACRLPSFPSLTAPALGLHRSRAWHYRTPAPNSQETNSRLTQTPYRLIGRASRTVRTDVGPRIDEVAGGFAHSRRFRMTSDPMLLCELRWSCSVHYDSALMMAASWLLAWSDYIIVPPCPC
jgi:hypothetical protein